MVFQIGGNFTKVCPVRRTLVSIVFKYSRMEVEAFININSKGKRVKTDLAESLKAEMFQKNVRDSSEYVQLVQ